MAQDSGSVNVTSAGIGLQGSFSPRDLNEYINPAADPRLNSILKKLGSPLRQGIIQQLDDMVAGNQKYPFACRFMFNPTTLDVGYSTSESSLSVAQQTADQLAAVNLGPGQTSLSFSLLFDRTYEVAYGQHPQRPRDLKNIGVYADIAALEAVVGARNNFAVNADSVMQSMRNVPCYFVFGGGGGTIGLSFIGSVQSMQVTYSLFSEKMVPTRAGVTLNVTQVLGKSLKNLTENGGTLLQRAQERGRIVRGGQNLPAIPGGRGGPAAR